MAETGRSKLDNLAGLGQSVWLDSLSRNMLDSGELAGFLSKAIRVSPPPHHLRQGDAVGRLVRCSGG